MRAIPLVLIVTGCLLLGAPTATANPICFNKEIPSPQGPIVVNHCTEVEPLTCRVRHGDPSDPLPWSKVPVLECWT